MNGGMVGRWWGKRKRPLGCVIHELNEWVDVAEKGAVVKTKNLGGDIRKMENVCNWVRKRTKLNGNRTTAMSKKILPLVIAAVLSVSLVGIAAAEDFGCSCHSDISENFATSLHYTGAGMKD
ncbi:MAG: hypothetical protein C5S38_02665 [Candidatus Methanophagaceae archaeon]|nr:MAG: hypothetical protein C5S38_02665 [Methanophagales archaeon]KAF5430301.1 hypothetical protein C5S36_13425 [Methanophagales archaeon]